MNKTDSGVATSGGAEKLEELKKVIFRCSKCGLCEDVHYFGRRPPFTKKTVEFKEPSYVMRDPFSPRDACGGGFLLIGGTCAGDCAEEVAAVCVDCSIFYEKRFCLDCSCAHLKEFPDEMQTRIQKKLEQQRHDQSGKS